MAHVILPIVIVALTTGAPRIDLNAQSKDPITALKSNPAVIFIAQKYGDQDPHGPDPHGDDPHDEHHDKGMEANKEQKEHKAPKDVYGGDIYNKQQPYE
jgi:hypothetical protein